MPHALDCLAWTNTWSTDRLRLNRREPWLGDMKARTPALLEKFNVTAVRRLSYCILLTL